VVRTNCLGSDALDSIVTNEDGDSAKASVTGTRGTILLDV
jgi:hypothetical protein